jgi:hypothetical protein
MNAEESMAPEQQLVTQLLREWGAGSKQALDQLMPLVYDELRTLAETLHGDPT